MLIAGLRFICRRAYAPPGVLGLTLGSVPAVLVAAFWCARSRSARSAS